MTKRGSSFGYESSHVLRGRVSIGDRYFLLGGVYVFMRDVVRTFVSFLFFPFQLHNSYIVIANLVLIFYVYIY